MHSNRSTGRVTSSTGNVGPDGQIVGHSRQGTTLDPGRYRERPGLNARIRQAGADVPMIRRLLGLEAVAS